VSKAAEHVNSPVGRSAAKLVTVVPFAVSELLQAPSAWLATFQRV